MLNWFSRSSSTFFKSCLFSSLSELICCFNFVMCARKLSILFGAEVSLFVLFTLLKDGILVDEDGGCDRLRGDFFLGDGVDY